MRVKVPKLLKVSKLVTKLALILRRAGLPQALGRHMTH
jgi:hypothetical protein